MVLSVPAFAAEAPLNASARAAIVQTLVKEIDANYIEPAVAKRVSNAIMNKNAEGGYASATSAQALSAALANDLREFSGDKHFGSRVEEQTRASGSTAPMSRQAEVEAVREGVVRQGYRIEKVERLPGNVGYIELRGFGFGTFVGPGYTSAMTLMAGTDALILDLRRNGGGSASGVALLMSHFFPLMDSRHLNDSYDHPSGTTQQFWTVPSVAPRYDKPVYVLTSGRTFSAGEECAYNFQTQKRGTVVGETTGGGANPVSWYSVGNGIIVAIPNGRSINPITKTSWERVGVKPDIPVPAAQALQTAHVTILRNLVTGAKEDKERAELQRVLAMVEKGEVEKPIYTLRGEK
jgi:C-terminal processing protease CtpA/Prc